ncbi:MAG TPA: LCP family protein, partial [Candidatus Limnocylindrales bacterium]|nr:LCP family protein [Candidatus Limnocylindrales bacterium]
RPDSRPSDLRRLIAATLSSVLPGLGQAANVRVRPAIGFAAPTAIVLLLTWLIAHADSPAMLLARAITPAILSLLLVLNVAILAWRLLALLQAFLDRRYPRRPGRLGAAGLVVLLAFTIVPHVLAWNAGTAAQQTFARIFSGSAVRSVSAAPLPSDTERLNVLLIGVDSAPGRTEALTDSLIVVSLDPVGRTVSMVSIPRDLAGVPLGNGNTFAPKINSLVSYADRHPAEFPGGGIATLERAVGALFGIPIHAYATVDLAGFVTMVDAVGGVDIDVRKPLADPKYPRLDGRRGWSVEPGRHHFDGTDALAYARIRKAVGESDLTRAARQQEVLVALRNGVANAGILFRLPSLLAAVGTTVHTDLPADRLPQLAALAEQIGGASTVKVVLTSPQIKAASSAKYGSIFLPVATRIAQLAKVVFGLPGADPTWPVGSRPAPSASGGPGSGAQRVTSSGAP